jgi:Ca2+-binding RTX toxin-like protein
MSESLRGTNLIDYIWGLGGDDSIQGLGGNDVIDGGDGIDTSVYAKNASSYSMNMPINGQIFVSGSDGVDQLTGIERIRFADKSIAIDVDGNAGIAAKILGAVFGKSAVSNKEYVGIGLDLLDKGMSHDTLAGLALNAAKATTNDQIVTTLWTNVVGSAPSAADKAPFIKMLEDGMTPGALAQMAADTSINTTNINLVGLAQTGIDFTSAG